MWGLPTVPADTKPSFCEDELKKELSMKSSRVRVGEDTPQPSGSSSHRREGGGQWTAQGSQQPVKHSQKPTGETDSGAGRDHPAMPHDLTAGDGLTVAACVCRRSG